MNIEQLLTDLQVRAHAYQQKGLRRGQSLFNALYDSNPDIANKIRGTEKDPFYKNHLESVFLFEVEKLRDESKNL